MPSFASVEMDTTPIRCLTNSISRFVHLVSCQTSKAIIFLKDFESMATMLKHLKPVLDDVEDGKVRSDENLWRECEGLDVSVNAAREFMERWSPKMSRILSLGLGLTTFSVIELLTRLENVDESAIIFHLLLTSALRSEQLLTKIRDSSLEICCILCRLLRTLPSSSNLAVLQVCTEIMHSVQEFQNWQPERVTKLVKQAMKSKNDKLGEHLVEIIEYLGLLSNQDLLKESIAVEKEIERKCVEEIDQIVGLLALIRDHMLKTGCFMNGISVPSYFCCPLSLDFMLDPVIVASGQTFDRSSMQKWLENGLRICPKTRQHLLHTNLIPNYTVKALISNWFQENNLKLPSNADISNVNPEASQDVIRTDSFRCSVRSSGSLSGSSVDVGDAVRSLKIDDPSVSGEVSSSTCQSVEVDKSNHRSPEHSYTHSRTQSISSVVSSCDYMPVTAAKTRTHDGRESFGGNAGYDVTTTPAHGDKLVEDLKSSSNKLQTEAASELRLLARQNVENRAIIAKCGAIRPLISLLHSDVRLTQEHAVTALLNLSLDEENKSKIGEQKVIEPLIQVLKSGTDTAKENSAATLFSLSVLEEYKVKIGQSGAIKPLVDLLASGTVRGKKDALTALFNLSICHDNKARIVKAGAVKYLVELLDSASGMVDKSVALLANLSTITEGRSVIAREGAIPLMVEIVDMGSNRGKENAAAVLLQMCLNSNKFCNLVLQEGAIPPLVALSQSGTARAKEKAQQLLSHFRSQREGNTGRKKK